MPDGETLHIGGIAADTKDAARGWSMRASRFRPCRRVRSACRASCPTGRRIRGGARRAGLRSASTITICASAHALSESEALPLRRRAGVKAICRKPRTSAYGLWWHGPHFAPRGTLTEWEHYARGLVERPGCGDLEPTLTRVVREAGNMIALVLTTRVAPGTIDLAQVAFILADAAKASHGGSWTKPAVWRSRARRVRRRSSWGTRTPPRGSSMNRWASNRAPPS